MAKEEPTSVSKDLKELQRKLSLLIKSFQNNSKVAAFMKSPVGQCLDRHPFLALSVLVFVAMSAVPVGLFLLLVVLSSLAALVGVILLEGLVISVGGLTLLCVLSGLVFLSLAISGTVMVSSVVIGSLISYWFSSRIHPGCEPYPDRQVLKNSTRAAAESERLLISKETEPLAKQNPSANTPLAMKAADLAGLYQE